MAELATFWALFLVVLLAPARRARLAAKPRADWLLDLAGLAVQGGLIPLLQAGLLLAALRAAWPEAEGALSLGAAGAFLLNFVAVDALYYWNHRAFHRPRLWPVHAVHHTMTELDVLGTSRNTLWTSLLIVYVWVNAVLVFVIEERAAYLAAVSLTACLDLWRHSPAGPPAGGRLDRLLGLALITPNDHAWHHARDVADVNFGANLSLWDRAFGTLYRPGRAPAALGVPSPLGLGRRLWWPFPSRAGG
jgi:sterol desaturase/sphingolipid hydroxylase (fatty acid hydroxylase superfamily)